jgi:hypothetical protein
MLRFVRFASLAFLALCATPTLGEAQIRTRVICFGRIASPPVCPRGSFAFCLQRSPCRNLATGRSFSVCSAYSGCVHIPPFHRRPG